MTLRRDDALVGGCHFAVPLGRIVMSSFRNFSRSVIRFLDTRRALSAPLGNVLSLLSSVLAFLRVPCVIYPVQPFRPVYGPAVSFRWFQRKLSPLLSFSHRQGPFATPSFFPLICLPVISHQRCTSTMPCNSFPALSSTLPRSPVDSVLHLASAPTPFLCPDRSRSPSHSAPSHLNLSCLLTFSRYLTPSALFGFWHSTGLYFDKITEEDT
jgi:hypothetical protein